MRVPYSSWFGEGGEGCSEGLGVGKRAMRWRMKGQGSIYKEENFLMKSLKVHLPRGAVDSEGILCVSVSTAFGHMEQKT